jgi:hypothetical protein
MQVTRRYDKNKNEMASSFHETGVVSRINPTRPTVSEVIGSEPYVIVQFTHCVCKRLAQSLDRNTTLI